MEETGDGFICSAAMKMVEENQNQPHISDTRIKSKEEKDRISSLPDCLLIDILSRLPSTEIAIKTGTLSKRWTSLWTSVPCLVFAFDDLYTQRPYDCKRRRFFSFVNKTLNQCRQLNLKKFDIKLHTSFDSEAQSHVEKWIRFAINSNVHELNIKLWVMHEESDFEFDESFFVASCFTRLKLPGCLFNYTGAISWKNLNTLYIQFGTLDEDLIENILSGSPMLETLVLDNCYGYSRLDITSKSVKNLVISGYEPPGFEELCIKYSVFHVETDEDFDETIEINAPNILSLTIKEDLALWKLLLLNVSSLVKVDLDYDKRGFYEIPLKEEEQMLKELMLKLGHVKELNIGKSCSKVFSRLEAKGFILPLNKDYVHVTSPLCPNDDILELGNSSLKSGY